VPAASAPAVPAASAPAVPAASAPAVPAASAPAAPAASAPAAQTPAEQPASPPAAAPDSDAREDAQDRPAGAPVPVPSQQPSAPAPAAASPFAATPAPVDAGQAAAAAQPSTSAPASAGEAASHRPGVLLSHAAETVRLTISAASAQGVSRVRIALRPAELGGIEIMLAHGPAGLSATIRADSAQAAQALQRSVDELQRTLQSQGLNVVRIDISVAGDGSAARGREDRDGPADHHGTRHERESDRETDSPTAPRTIELPTGVLVDVLA